MCQSRKECIKGARRTHRNCIESVPKLYQSITELSDLEAGLEMAVGLDRAMEFSYLEQHFILGWQQAWQEQLVWNGYLARKKVSGLGVVSGMGRTVIWHLASPHDTTPWVRTIEDTDEDTDEDTSAG